MDSRDIAKKVIDEAKIQDVISYYLPVTKKGRNYKAVCPFHDDTNPSLTISTEKKIFKCFVCGVGGNAITFVQKYENLSFAQAIKKVAEISHIDLPELEKFAPIRVDDPIKKEKAALTYLSKLYQVALNSDDGKNVMDYLKKRGLSQNQIDRFKIGFAPFKGEDTIKLLFQNGYSIKNLEDIGVLIEANGKQIDRFNGRLVFPIADENGQIVGFSGRALQKDKEIAKYLNSPESPLFLKSKILYNYQNIKRYALLKKDIYLCEGFMDVIALDRYDIPALATMGTSLTSDHLRLLRGLKSNIVVLMDGDSAGRLATLKIARTLFLNSIPFKVIHQEGEARDPDEIIKSEGEEGITKYIANQLTYLEYLNAYYINNLQEKSKRDEYLKLAFEIVEFYEERDIVSFEFSLKSIAKVLGVNLTTLQKEYLRSQSKKDIGAEYFGKTPKKEMSPIQVTKTSLQRSEGQLLSLMLQNSEAISYYKENLNNMSDELYNEIASYIIKISEENDDVNIGSIIALMDADEFIEQKEKMKEAVLELEEDSDNPDTRYSKETLESLVKTIQDEQRQFGYDKQIETIKNSNIPDLDKIRLIAKVEKQKRDSISRKKKA